MPAQVEEVPLAVAPVVKAKLLGVPTVRAVGLTQLSLAGGQVLGVQVPPEELPQWKAFVAGLPYPHWDETDNPAYRLFLGPQVSPLPLSPDLVRA